MYCSHFSLQRLPFNNTPDPAFYYSTPDHEEALATLQYAAQQRKGFVLVTGEVGAGKTLIGRMFLRHIDPSATVAVISNTHLNGRQLLAAICSEFGIAVPAESSNLELTQRLQEYLVQQFARDRHVIVLLDEGQNLPDESFEELRMLGNLEADDAKLLQVCILGQPELRDRFRKPGMRQLDQRLFRRFHLAALNRQQTGEYIRHRLSVAGAQNEGLFAPAAVDRIFAASRGIPRLINQICDNALLTGYGRDVLMIDAEVIDLVLERDVSLGCSDQCGSGAPGPQLPSDNAREALIDASESRKLSELALEQARQMATQIQQLGAGPELHQAEIEKIAERQNELQKIVAGATTRWLTAKEKLEGYRREIQGTLDAVAARCDAIQAQVQEVAADAAPAEDIQELRETQLREIRRVMAAVDRQREEASQQIERLKHSLAETSRQLTALSSESTSAQAVERLIAQQDARIADLIKDVETRQESTQSLVRAVEQQCQQTQLALESLRETAMRRADEASASIEQLTNALAHAEGEVAGLRQEIAAGLGRAQDAIARLEANSGSEGVEALRVEGERVRAQQAEALAEFGRRVEEQSARLQRFREVIARHSSKVSRTHRSYIEQFTEKLAEQATQLATMRCELAEREPEMQRRLDALTEQFAKREDLESLCRLADELKAGQSAAEQGLERLSANQVTVEQVRAAQRAEIASVATELGEQRRMLEAHLQELIARVQADEALGEQHAADTEKLQTAVKAQRVDLETLAHTLEQRCDDLRTRIDTVSSELGGVEEARAGVERHALELVSLRADLQDYRIRFEALLAQLSTDADRTRAGLEAVANRTAMLEATAEQTRAEGAALRGDLELLIRKQNEDVGELLKGLSEQRRSLEAGIDSAVRQVAQTHEQLTALQSSAATSSDLDAVRSRHTQDMETVLNGLAERRKDLDAFTADVDRRCRELLEEVQRLAAVQTTPEQLQALRDEHAARMAALAVEIEQRGQVLERAIQDVGERCQRTQAATETLTAKADATAGELQDFRRDNEQKLSGIVHRLDAEHAAYQHEVAELETALSQGVAGLERQLQQVSSELGHKVREATRRVGELESNQQAPLRIDLTPQVRGELAELVTSAKQEKEEMQAALERASAMTSHLHNTSARVQEVMQHWVDGASEVRRQSEQLRASALKAGEILGAMQRCHEALDAKLNSQRWQSELQRGEKLSARLETAAADARTASLQLSALLADFDRARSDVDGWTRRQEQATRLSDRLSKLLAEAEGATGHIDKKLENRKRLLNAITKNTGSLVSMIQSARLEDEELRPTAPAPSRRAGASANAKPTRQLASVRPEPQTAVAGHDRLASLRPAASIRWPRFQPEPLIA